MTKKTKKQPSFTDDLNELLGQKVFVLCNRYSYRGILTSVSPTHIRLEKSTAVEVMGRANADHPQKEDPIGTTMLIGLHFIELVFQPKCCFAPLPGEDGYKHG